LKDLQFALRRVRRAPLFSVAVMLILGLGIGASATTVSVVNAFMWRPVNVPNPEQLAIIGSRSKDDLMRTIPLRMIEALARSELSSDAPCAYSTSITATDINRQPGLTSLMLVAGDCFATLQVQPLLGRVIGPDEAPFQGKGSAVAMLSYGYWQRMFGGAPDVVGKTIRIETATATIVGVLPAHFTGLNKDLDAAVVVPFNSYRTHTASPFVLARLRGGRQLTQLESQLRTVWASALDVALPATLTGAARRASLDAEPEVRSASAGHSTLRNLYGSTFVNMAWLTGLLVLLTSINVGGLLCSRMAAKLPELAILRGLGATSARIVRTILMETVLLSLGGCAVGFPLAYVVAPAFVTLLPVGNVPWTISFTPDARVLAVAVGIAMLVAVVITAIPAWIATRRHSLALGADRSVTRATYRSTRVLLVLQVAATLVLVFGCSLLIRSLVALEHVDRGYRADDVLSIRLTPTAGGYSTLDQPAYYRELVGRVTALPGVTSVGMARYFGTVPNERAWYGPVSWSGEEQAATTAIYEYVSPEFFQTVGIPILRGRDFSWSDAPGAPPVVLVSDSLARILEPDSNVIGRFLRYGAEPARQKLQIVGVVGNISFGNSRSTEIRTVYFPGIQVGEATFGTLHIRTRADLGAVAGPVREILGNMGHEQVVVMSTIDRLFENWLVAERMGAAVSSAVTILALCIACVGVFALLGYTVARRTREIGVRIAVGATPRHVSSLVLRDALVLVGAGLCVGIPAAVMSARVLESLVFGITVSDVTTLIASATLLIVMALSAAVIPAWRAVRVDPMIALRAE
jgi:putative ABC transport system permease protein